MISSCLDIDTYLSELHLKVLAVVDSGVDVRELLGGGLDLKDNLDVGKDDNSSGKDEAKEQHAHDKTLSGH